jgi:hypothetical protein
MIRYISADIATVAFAANFPYLSISFFIILKKRAAYAETTLLQSQLLNT